MDHLTRLVEPPRNSRSPPPHNSNLPPPHNNVHLLRTAALSLLSTAAGVPHSARSSSLYLHDQMREGFPLFVTFIGNGPVFAMPGLPLRRDFKSFPTIVLSYINIMFYFICYFQFANTLAYRP
jgi:hypothetical protein